MQRWEKTENTVLPSLNTHHGAAGSLALVALVVVSGDNETGHIIPLGSGRMAHPSQHWPRTGNNIPAGNVGRIGSATDVDRGSPGGK